MLPWWLRQESICLQCRRHGFDPWVGKIPWRREGLPTPVFLPGEFHGQRSLGGYSPWGHKESDMSEWLNNNNNKPIYIGFPGGSDGKEFACNAGDMDLIPGSGKSPGEGGNPLPVFLSRESHGQRSLAGYSPWGRKESNMTEATNIYLKRVESWERTYLIGSWVQTLKKKNLFLIGG